MLRRSPSLETEQRLQQNIQIAREQKQLLQAQRDAGEIDDAAFDSAYRDLQTALALELDQEKRKAAQAPGKWMLPVVMLAIPLASIALYLNFGEYRVVENPQLAQATDPQQNRAAPQMTLDEMQTAIRERLQQQPGRCRGLVHARAYLYGKARIRPGGYRLPASPRPHRQRAGCHVCFGRRARDAE